jgi:acetolactate synthase-1/2/3 large subunit
VVVADRLTGGTQVARALRELGAEIIFSVSGNQILPIYDAAGEAGPRIIHTRHESAAAYAAIGAAEMTSGPGVLLVSAGPGFIAALTGVAVARSMELPLLFLSGGSPLAMAGRGAFQELDQARMAGVVCKASRTVESVAELGPAISGAWTTALEGIPGPVHVQLPADILGETGEYTQVDVSQVEVPLDEDAKSTLRQATARLAQARRPVVIARPAAARGAAGTALATLCAKLGIAPLVTDAPRGLSDLKYAEGASRLPDADVALVVAPADFATGFLDLNALAREGEVLLLDAPGDPEPRREPHIHLRTEALSDALETLSEALPAAPADEAWRALWTIRAPPETPRDAQDNVHPLAVTDAVRAVLQPDDVLVLDGGEFCQWVRWGVRDLPNTVIWNGKLGAIGGGIPTALGVAATRPGARVLCVLGDGSAGYHLSEFETAVRYELPIVALIGNDARWAAEWHLQVDRYGPERAFETTLTEARYERAVEGFGGAGNFITDATQLQPLLAQALDGAWPSCLNVRIASLRSPAIVH